MLVRLGSFFILLCLCFSCTVKVPLKIRNNFKYCYDPKTDYSKSDIKFNGYYNLKYSSYRITTHNHLGEEVEYIKPISYQNMFFFKDGLVAISQAKVEATIYEKNYLKRIQEGFEPESTQFYSGNYWGIYTISNDTIKIHCLSHQSFLNPYWTSIEVWYKIINDNILKIIYAKDYMHDNKRSYKESNDTISMEFYNTDVILKSEPWLKNEEWFWCDKEQFRQWKKEKE